MEYPLAVKCFNQPGIKDNSTTAGMVYAVDLMGSFFGAILTAVFLLPVMGIKNALLLIVFLKGGSLAMVAIGEMKKPAR